MQNDFLCIRIRPQILIYQYHIPLTYRSFYIIPPNSESPVSGRLRADAFNEGAAKTGTTKMKDTAMSRIMVLSAHVIPLPSYPEKSLYDLKAGAFEEYFLMKVHLVLHAQVPWAAIREPAQHVVDIDIRREDFLLHIVLAVTYRERSLSVDIPVQGTDTEAGRNIRKNL